MMRKFSLFLCIVLLLSGCAPRQNTLSENTSFFVLFDPGHGGFDGGTVTEEGTAEKHINLAISLLLRDILNVSGIPVEMTRDSDTALQEDGLNSIRQKKVSDMKNRLSLYNCAGVVISIHQNHFSVPKYSGTQVFYSKNHPDSVVLAENIQNSVLSQLQPENNRENKAATDGIFLLHHTTAIAVLVECGFLSNPMERELLLNEMYRQTMAFAIATGYFRYISQK